MLPSKIYVPDKVVTRNRYAVKSYTDNAGQTMIWLARVVAPSVALAEQMVTALGYGVPLRSELVDLDVSDPTGVENVNHIR